MNKLLLLLLILIVISSFTFAQPYDSDSSSNDGDGSLTDLQDSFDQNPDDYIGDHTPVGVSVSMVGGAQGITVDGSVLSYDGVDLDLNVFSDAVSGSQYQISKRQSGGFEITVADQKIVVDKNKKIPDNAKISSSKDSMIISIEGETNGDLLKNNQKFNFKNLADSEVYFDDFNRLVILNNDKQTILKKDKIVDDINVNIDGNKITASKGTLISHQYDSQSKKTFNLESKGDGCSINIGNDFLIEGEFSLALVDEKNNRWQVSSLENEKTSFYYNKDMTEKEVKNMGLKRGAVWTGEDMYSIGKTSTTVFLDKNKKILGINSPYDSVISKMNSKGFEIVDYPTNLRKLDPVDDEEHINHKLIEAVDGEIARLNKLKKSTSDKDKIKKINIAIKMQNKERKELSKKKINLVNVDVYSNGVAYKGTIMESYGSRYLTVDKIMFDSDSNSNNIKNLKIDGWVLEGNELSIDTDNDGRSNSNKYKKVNIETKNDVSLKITSDNSYTATIHTLKKKYGFYHDLGSIDLKVGGNENPNLITIHHEIDVLKKNLKSKQNGVVEIMKQKSHLFNPEYENNPID
ncbi:hypothetical protein HN415_09545, partial [Candidatus Woesearchaeota archaeon]|nr:hypothetical protein [Candidatus Woesearchaeota archaeon]